VLGPDWDLPHRLAEVPGSLERFLARAQAGRHLYELHQLRRQAKMHADEALVASGAGGDLGNGQGRGVGCEDRALGTGPVELSEQAVLYFEVFEHRLDHDVARGQRADVSAAREIGHDLPHLLGRELSALDGFRKEPLGLPARARERFVTGVVHDGPEPGACGNDGDTRTHRPAPCYAYGSDFVRHHPLPIAHHSAVMPTSLMTFAQLANSDLRNAPNCSGELPTGSAPTPTMRSCTAGSASALTRA